MAVLMLGVSYFVQADGASDSAWAWYVTVEDPQGKMGTTASVYLLTETTISLSSLDSAIANGNFDAQIATRHFLLTLGQQDVYFNVPYALNEFNQHGIYVLFSDGDPLKSKYYSVGYFSTFREGLASPPPGFYFDSDGQVVLCHCNISTVTFANAKRTGWSGNEGTIKPISGLIVRVW